MVIKRILIVSVMLLALAGLLWFGFGPDQSKKQGRSGHHGGVPVLTQAATTQNVPVILHGVGTVQAFQTVTVKPQVGGKLLSINFTEGQQVHEGDVLAKIDPTTYRAALEESQGKLAMDQASLANARLDLKRYAKLAKTNYVSQQQADQARATVRQDAAQVKSDQASVDGAQATLGYTSIVAPISGRTGIRMVDEGNIVSAGGIDAIVVITQLQPINVVFTLPADDIGRVRAAANGGVLPVSVLGSDSATVLDTGKLTVINNQVDETTGTIKLKARLANDKQNLWPGQFVNVRLQIGMLKQATIVPVAAVQQGPDGAFVYLVGKGDKAAMQPVKVVQQNETQAVIGQGVTPGEPVITAGFGQLSDGARIKVGNAGKPKDHAQNKTAEQADPHESQLQVAANSHTTNAQAQAGRHTPDNRFGKMSGSRGLTQTTGTDEHAAKKRPSTP
ncbi:MAG: efflux RND transporter periplasmic adaptor subunit [Salinisphaera sp.]|jgi:multidrug efflux system membrane fusion protein|nr:efflux RND transporter periplasmic adaptor subunit [Salinisphaera sp.]